MINRAKWIGIPDGEICDTIEFRRNICISKQVKKAVLKTTAIGVYCAFIDDVKIGDEVLTPGWTNYKKRVFYRENDVTDIIKNNSTLKIICGKGWAVGRMGADDSRVQYSDKILCGYSLETEYTDGSRDVFLSDENTEVWTSQIRYSDIYNGETLDLTYVPEKLGNARTAEYDTEIVPHSGEKIVEHGSIRPAKHITTPKGENVIDFGQNLTGYVRIKIKGNKGDEILFRHAEILDFDGNFYTENLRKAKNEIKYVLSGNDDILYPKLSFQGFRYICLDKYPGEIDLNCFEAIPVYSDIKRTGSFVCGYDKLNKLYENIIWGQRDNFLDIPTDCPQRDERLGWTGDAQIFVKTAAMNYNVEKFFEKWLWDLRSEQTKDGAVPSVVPDCMKAFDMLISAAWGDCAVIVPWEIYRAYGNRQILCDSFESMKKWVEYMHNFGSEEFLWIGGKHYGDWLATDSSDGSYKGITDDDFIASCFFAYSTSLLIKAGKEIGRDVSNYEIMYPKIIEKINERFIENGLPTSKTQTACAMAICFDICEDKNIIGEMLCGLIEKAGGKLTTGFVGTPYLLQALTETGHSDVAYELLLNEGYPSWLYAVNHGATTMWEHWDGIKEDGSFWSSDMNSYNHYAYGAVYGWIFENIGGIRIKDAGYKSVAIKPIPDKRLKFSEVKIDTGNGTLRSFWEYREDMIRYETEIPDNTKAEIILPDGRIYNVSGGRHIFFTDRA